MTDVLSGWQGYAMILLIALLVQEPWRWLGLYFGRSLSVQSPVFLWVRLVATALVAALVMRIVLFPPGALQDIAIAYRLLALACAVAAYYLTSRNMALGVVVGGATLLVLQTTLTAN